jgi:cellulose synthase/poly-beta-1,6-N-acetylglucosamine synthase-like glycosyltransferase
MAPQSRYAIVTPYYKEDRSLLRKCIDSVKGQSVKTDHILVADGHPQSWIDDEPVRHIRLDRAHGDYGNTPRGVGALIAIAEEYDGIGLLDADNWLDGEHVQACLSAASECPGGAAQCDYVIARRRFRRIDDTVMPIVEETEHVDTNCYFFLPGGFCVIPRWALMPRNIASACDRIFYQMLRRQPFRFASVSKQTVNYRCMWESLYLGLKEIPPEGAKPNIGMSDIDGWLRSLTPRQFEIANRLSGVSLEQGMIKAIDEGANGGLVSRNAPCPCGSGKKFKHCHGALSAV